MPVLILTLEEAEYIREEVEQGRRVYTNILTSWPTQARTDDTESYACVKNRESLSLRVLSHIDDSIAEEKERYANQENLEKTQSASGAGEGV